MVWYNKQSVDLNEYLEPKKSVAPNEYLEPKKSVAPNHIQTISFNPLGDL